MKLLASEQSTLRPWAVCLPLQVENSSGCRHVPGRKKSRTHPEKKSQVNWISILWLVLLCPSHLHKAHKLKDKINTPELQSIKLYAGGPTELGTPRNYIGYMPMNPSPVFFELSQCHGEKTGRLQNAHLRLKEIRPWSSHLQNTVQPSIIGSSWGIPLVICNTLETSIQVKTNLNFGCQDSEKQKTMFTVT